MVVFQVKWWWYSLLFSVASGSFLWNCKETMSGRERPVTVLSASPAPVGGYKLRHGPDSTHKSNKPFLSCPQSFDWPSNCPCQRQLTPNYLSLCSSGKEGERTFVRSRLAIKGLQLLNTRFLCSALRLSLSLFYPFTLSLHLLRSSERQVDKQAGQLMSLNRLSYLLITPDSGAEGHMLCEVSKCRVACKVKRYKWQKRKSHSGDSLHEYICRGLSLSLSLSLTAWHLPFAIRQSTLTFQHTHSSVLLSSQHSVHTHTHRTQESWCRGWKSRVRALGIPGPSFPLWRIKDKRWRCVLEMINIPFWPLSLSLSFSHSLSFHSKVGTIGCSLNFGFLLYSSSCSLLYTFCLLPHH